MAAADALIAMTAQCRGAAADDGIEHLAMRPCKMRLLLFPETVARSTDDVGHLEGGPAHRFICPPGALHFVRAGHFDRFERAGNRLQVASGQVQVDGGVSELGMSEKNLDGAQVGAGFQHVRCETMSQRMRRYVLGDAGTLGGLVHSLPDDLLRNGHISPPALHRTWEQIGLGLHPAPVLAQGLQQLRGQQHVAIAAALALTDMNDHALAVDVGDLEVAQLGPAQPGCIQHHQHGAMHQVLAESISRATSCWSEYGRQPPLDAWEKECHREGRAAEGS